MKEGALARRAPYEGKKSKSGWGGVGEVRVSRKLNMRVETCIGDRKTLGEEDHWFSKNASSNFQNQLDQAKGVLADVFPQGISRKRGSLQNLVYGGRLKVRPGEEGGLQKRAKGGQKQDTHPSGKKRVSAGLKQGSLKGTGRLPQQGGE